MFKNFYVATPTSKNSVSEAQKEGAASPSSQRKTEVVRDDREIKEAGMGQQAYLEAVGLDEAGETMGKVSEVLSNTREQDGDGKPAAGGTKAQATQQDPAAKLAQILAKMPPEKEMRAQIKKEIEKEINYLHKKAMDMLKAPGKINYFEVNNMMRKVRDLKGLLFSLVRASVDGLKALWLRFVHGIM